MRVAILIHHWILDLFILFFLICCVEFHHLPVLFQLLPPSFLKHLLLMDLYLLFLHHGLLFFLDNLHFAFEVPVVEFLGLSISFNLFHLVEFLNVCDQRRDDPLYFEVLSKEPPRANLMAAAGTLFLLLARIAVNALCAELVQTVLHVDWMVIHVKADRALESSLLYFVEEVQIDVLVIVFFLLDWLDGGVGIFMVRFRGLNEQAWLAHHLVVV